MQQHAQILIGLYGQASMLRHCSHNDSLIQHASKLTFLLQFVLLRQQVPCITYIYINDTTQLTSSYKRLTLIRSFETKSSQSMSSCVTMLSITHSALVSGARYVHSRESSSLRADCTNVTYRLSLLNQLVFLYSQGENRCKNTKPTLKSRCVHSNVEW